MQASPAEGQSLQQKGKKGEKGTSISAQCPSQNVVKYDASGKKGKLLCCKCHFDQIKANLAEIQPENHQNVQKMHFWQKALGVNGLKELCTTMTKLLHTKIIIKPNSCY